MKTARFSDLVAQSGRPAVHLAWAPPAKDLALQKALKADRVVTVHQRTRGAKKDYAVLGLEIAHDAQYLIFPKSLKSFKERKIVGIRYDLLEDSLSVGPTPAGRAKAKAMPKTVKHAKIIPFAAAAADSDEMTDAPIGRDQDAAVPKQPKPPRLNAAVKKILKQISADLATGLSRKAEASLAWLLGK